ncbi:MAG TPA: AbrB/MazE/SpoVT family DNA-binding domain-containing protein [Bacteroidales bacterium]|nr:AbrB/MazE/SpoVT family DNA-binding domain-containing protein [Bacteroidales bacterium]
MTRRKLDEENVRSLLKIGSSYAVTIPIEIIQKLKWKEKQKLDVRIYQERVIIKELKE